MPRNAGLPDRRSAGGYGQPAGNRGAAFSALIYLAFWQVGQVGQDVSLKLEKKKGWDSGEAEKVGMGKRLPDLPDLPESQGNQRAGLPRAGGLRAGIEGRASAGPAGADRRRGWHGAELHPARASVDAIRA
jgi:hypothetical protein